MCSSVLAADSWGSYTRGSSYHKRISAFSTIGLRSRWRSSDGHSFKVQSNGADFVWALFHRVGQAGGGGIDGRVAWILDVWAVFRGRSATIGYCKDTAHTKSKNSVVCKIVTNRSAIFCNRPIRYRYWSKMADHRSDSFHNRSNNVELHFLRNANSSFFLCCDFSISSHFGQAYCIFCRKVAIFGMKFFLKNSVL